MINKKKYSLIFLTVILSAVSISNCTEASQFISLPPSHYAVWEIHGVTNGKIGLETEVLEAGGLLDILLFNSEEQFRNYYENGSINPCFWATGGWHGIAGPLNDGSMEELYLPYTPKGTTYYLVFDNTNVTAVSMWKDDIETQYDGHPYGGFAFGNNEIQVRYNIDFGNLIGNIYTDGPQIYKLNILEEGNNSFEKRGSIPGFESSALLVVIGIILVISRREGLRS